jgi:hypothetical protein
MGWSLRTKQIFTIMSQLKTFLKVVQKLGYPNPSPDSLVIANSINYNLNNFIEDLILEVGEEKAYEFVNKTFSSLGATYSPGIKIDLSNRVGETGSHIYLIINEFEFVEGDNDYKEVWIHYTWGNNQLIHDGTGLTLDELYDEVDLGTMGEYDELINDIQYECIYQIFKETGLIIHFDSQQ